MTSPALVSLEPRSFGDVAGAAAAWFARAQSALRAAAQSLAWSMSRTSADGSSAKASADVSARFRLEVLPHLDGAYNLARFLTRDADAAEDVVQEACLRAFRSFADFRGGNPRAWLFAIVRNCHYDWRAERKREAERSAPVRCGSEDGEPDAFDLDQIAADIDSPETSLLRMSEAETVRAVLEAVPGTFREILVLRELEELSYREIAEVSAIPIGTVMSRLARARQLFEDLWRRQASKLETKP